VRKGLTLVPLIRGGGQEGRRRGGTENVAAIAGFGAAARLVMDEMVEMAQSPRFAAMRDRLERELAQIAPDLTIHGIGAQRVGNTSCFGARGFRRRRR